MPDEFTVDFEYLSADPAAGIPDGGWVGGVTIEFAGLSMNIDFEVPRDADVPIENWKIEDVQVWTTGFSKPILIAEQRSGARYGALLSHIEGLADAVRAEWERENRSIE